MKAISLWQPWASLMAAGVKTIETRGWTTSYRGELVICAAKFRVNGLSLLMMARFYDSGLVLEEDKDKTVKHSLNRLPYGAALCVVNWYDAEPTDQLQTFFCPARLTPQERDLGDYTPGRWAWKTRKCQRLRNPVPVRGRQGLFDLSPAEESAVRAQLKEKQ